MLYLFLTYTRVPVKCETKRNRFDFVSFRFDFVSHFIGTPFCLHIYF
jgi:hypothetical protein